MPAITNQPATYTAGEQVTVSLAGITNAAGQPINGAIYYADVLKPLLHKSIESWQSINKFNSTVKGGTAIYSLGIIMTTQDNDETGANINGVQADQISINLDYDKSIFYEVPLVNLARLGIDTTGALDTRGITLDAAYLMNWELGAAQAYTRYIYFKNLQLATNAAKNRVKDNSFIVDPETNTVDSGGLINIVFPSRQTASLDAYRAAWKALVDPLTMTSNLVSSYYTGINSDEFTVLISPRAKNALILAKSNLGSNMSFELLRDGEGERMILAGYNCMEAPFLGTSIAKGVVDKDEAFDFTGIDILPVHKEALAFPIVDILKTMMINPNNGNPRSLHKFAVNKDGGKAIRPQLVIGFSVTYGNLYPDQAVYNQEMGLLLTHLNTAANAVVAADAAPLAAPLETLIKAYTGPKTVIDVANVSTPTTNPVNAATVTTPTAFTASFTVPVLSGKSAQPTLTQGATAYYKNA